MFNLPSTDALTWAIRGVGLALVVLLGLSTKHYSEAYRASEVRLQAVTEELVQLTEKHERYQLQVANADAVAKDTRIETDKIKEKVKQNVQYIENTPQPIGDVLVPDAITKRLQQSADEASRPGTHPGCSQTACSSSSGSRYPKVL